MKRTYFSFGVHYYKNNVPATLRPFVDYTFSSGGITGDDYKTFEKKFKRVIGKLLPEGYSIHSWHSNHYECSWVIKTSDDKFIYGSIPDVRFNMNEWFTNILIRTMEHDKDFRGGFNNYTNIFKFKDDIKKLYK